VPPLVLRPLHQGLARQRVDEADRLSCVSITDLRCVGALFCVVVVVAGQRGSRDEMPQPSSWMLVARLWLRLRLKLRISRTPSVVDVHAPSMSQSRSGTSRMLVGGIDGSSDHPPSDRVRHRHRHRASPRSLVEHRHHVDDDDKQQQQQRQQQEHESGRQDSSSDVVESSVRDRCRRSHVPSDGADAEERERLGARSNVLGRVRAASRLLPSRLPTSPRPPRRP